MSASAVLNAYPHHVENRNSVAIGGASLWIERALAFLPILIAVLAILVMFAEPAFAQAMPWEGSLCRVANSLKGPVAKTIAVIVIVVTGLLLAVGEVGGVFKTLLGVLFGISLALFAADWVGFVDKTAASFSCTVS